MENTATISDTTTVKGMAPYLQVYDMPESIRFYRDKLGFKIEAQSQPEMGDDCDWVLLTLNGIKLMLNTIYEKQDRPSVKEELRELGHSDVALYFGCPYIDKLYHHFISKGLDLERPVITGYGFKAIYLKDPDGYGICYHWPENQ